MNYKDKQLPAHALRAQVASILVAAGSQQAEADAVAANLVMANLSGHDSHGVGMLPRYVDAVLEGGLTPNAGIKVLMDIGTLLSIDAQHGYGQVTGAQAMELAIARAQQHGSCIFTLANAHHLGRIGHFAEMATAQGLVSIHFVNVLSRPVVAPWGGGDGRFGTNPCCIGIPLPPSAGNAQGEAASVGASSDAGPPQVGTAPLGGSEAHGVASVGASAAATGRPEQGSTPSGGSAVREATSVGATIHHDLRLQDYRDIADGPYDAICSIEMVEAVGREYWATYFQAIARLLKPGGRACVQSIVIDDSLFDRYIESTDFIQQYIFPGGCLPCPREFRREAEKAGLQVVDAFAFGADYAETLKRWREKFLAEKARVLQLNFDERFMRLGEFYLAYCEAAFAESNIDVVQYTLRKA